MGAEFGWLELIKTIGALVALPTGVFVLVDHFLRGRPLVDLRPVGNDDPRLELEIANTSNRSIVIRSITCRPDALRASYGDDVGAIIDAAAGTPVKAVLLGPLKNEVFFLITERKWDDLPATAGVSITVRWSFTSSRWLPQIPIWLRSTVGKLNELRKIERDD